MTVEIQGEWHKEWWPGSREFKRNRVKTTENTFVTSDSALLLKKAGRSQIVRQGRQNKVSEGFAW